MVRLVVFFTVIAPILILWFTRRRPVWQCALWMVGIQLVLTLLYVFTNGLTLTDFFTGDSHGTITLLFIYVSDILAVFCFIGRWLWTRFRKVEPEIWDDRTVN